MVMVSASMLCVIYTGEWDNDRKHGRGIQTWPDGREYSGQWFNNNINGQGRYIRSDGSIYKGRFENGHYLKPLVLD